MVNYLLHPKQVGFQEPGVAGATSSSDHYVGSPLEASTEVHPLAPLADEYLSLDSDGRRAMLERADEARRKRNRNGILGYKAENMESVD